MFLQNFRETGRADANAACPYRAGHDKGRLWGRQAQMFTSQSYYTWSTVWNQSGVLRTKHN